MSVTVSAAAGLNSYPGVRFVQLTDAPPVRVCMAWTDPPTHPDVDALVRLAAGLQAARNPGHRPSAQG